MSRYVLVAVACLLGACHGAARPAVEPAHPPPTLERPARDLESVLRRNIKLAPLLDAAADHRLQVVLGVASPSGGAWWRESFRADAEYVYPASAIKLCVAVAALESLAELRSSTPELDVDWLLTHERQKRPRSLRRLVDVALVMSDNEASNELFDLAGHDRVHERMWSLGLSSFRMRHRLGIDAKDEPRLSPAMELVASGRRVSIPAREGRLELGVNEQDGVLVGRSHLSRDGRLVNEPLSFEAKNSVSITDLQRVLVAVMRPELMPETKLALGAQERAALIDALSAVPSGRGLSAEHDEAHKPFLAGVERVIPRRNLTLASKSGRAYGFLVDNAYVHDSRTGTSFFLAATLYTNPNGVINDDSYAYRTVAFRAFADIAETVTRYVLDDG